jgi:ABC-2 type transport system ATP-binding protein
MYFLEAAHIHKSYAGHQALTDVDLQVPPGQIYGLLGPNGAGKTSLIRIINRITAPDSGTLLWEGRPMLSSDIAHIGYLPEERGLYKKMKVGEQALYLARLKGLTRADAQARLRYWFEKFDLAEWTDKKVEELSKGMAQKIQFIITVLHEPKLLIFDEPFSGFDPLNAQLLKEEILYLKKQGATVLFSTHNMASVEEICDEISLINRSRVVLQGKVETIRQQFAKDSYSLQTEMPDGAVADGLTYDVLVSTVNGKRLELKVEKKKTATFQEMLHELSGSYRLLRFEQDIPNMNEIFIQTVHV